MSRLAIFPGSFDPFTLGHQDIVNRALTLFDTIVIAIGYNDQKHGWIPVQERLSTIRDLYHDNPRVIVDAYNTLTADYAQTFHGYDSVCLLRGVRSVKDYEYELGIADVNRRLTGIETVILFSSPHLASCTSSVVRELANFGHDISEWIPFNS